MARVGLICEAIWGDPHYSVKNADLGRSSASLTEPAADFDLETLSEFGFIPIEILVRPQGRKVVTMDDYGNPFCFVAKAAGGGNAGDESH